ncbi:hypothetical protein cand_031910 [Cryptosporidium andersoni]|uniref:Uncharacterized protein n=1 Tax=Cryptosporidium andersoni TaxID=117008 RepID=A0A1J4MBA4_9CRYT|nr:hypothetical protein cand_031910 [Cryptosporidium andersoni]
MKFNFFFTFLIYFLKHCRYLTCELDTTRSDQSEKNEVLRSLKKEWPALSDWLCEYLYCSSLRITGLARGNSIWGTGQLDASDDDHKDLHAASRESESVEPYTNSDHIMKSISELISHSIRLGIHYHQALKKNHETSTTTVLPVSKKTGVSNFFLKKISNSTSEVKNNKNKVNSFNNKKFSDLTSKILLKSNLSESQEKNLLYRFVEWLKSKHSSKFKANEQTESKNTESYLAFISSASVGPKLKSSRLSETTSNSSLVSFSILQLPDKRRNLNQFNNRPNRKLSIDINNAVFAAYFASDSILLHLSKTLSRDRRVKFGQEIGTVELYVPSRKIHTTDIILSRCDGTISILNHMKGIPIRATRLFLVITCDDIDI